MLYFSYNHYIVFVCRITVSSEGIQWMGLTHENLLWACTSTQVTMWNLNHFVDFFSISRTRMHKLCLQSANNKSTRLLAVGDDSWYVTVCILDHYNVPVSKYVHTVSTIIMWKYIVFL